MTFSKPANIQFYLQMYTSAIRARMATSFAARRGFSTTRTQLGSPYHYAEGPRTNIPFNPHAKRFFWSYWTFMGEQSPMSMRIAMTNLEIL